MKSTISIYLIYFQALYNNTAACALVSFPRTMQCPAGELAIRADKRELEISIAIAAGHI